MSDTHSGMVLNAPDVLNSIGGTSFGSFVGGCDYAGTDLTKIYCTDVANNLFTSDTTTGAMTLLGNFGGLFSGETSASLDWDPVTGTMYMLSTNTTSGSLYTLDLNTAIATRVGATSNCPIAGGFDAAGQLWSYDICTDNMYSVNTTTGAATLVGPIGFNANFGQGMDFDPTDNTCYLFAFNSGTFQPELRICDTGTGGSTLVGVIGQTTPGSLVQLGGAAVLQAANQTSIPPLAIPTLGNMSLVLLGLLLVGIVLMRFRARA